MSLHCSTLPSSADPRLCVVITTHRGPAAAAQEVLLSVLVLVVRYCKRDSAVPHSQTRYFWVQLDLQGTLSPTPDWLIQPNKLVCHVIRKK